MSEKPKRTGLGASIFFRPQPAATQEQKPADAQPTQSPRPIPAQAESKKVRTTINLFPESLALLDLLKVHARKDGRKATYSDILDEALKMLAQKKDIQA